MKIPAPAGAGGVDPIHSVSPLRTRVVGGIQAPSRADIVEISEMARFLDKLSRLPDVRQDKIDAVRDQIARGAYETPDKLEKAIVNLLRELW
jgi:hypothetical protein